MAGLLAGPSGRSSLGPRVISPQAALGIWADLISGRSQTPCLVPCRLSDTSHDGPPALPRLWNTYSMGLAHQLDANASDSATGAASKHYASCLMKPSRSGHLSDVCCLRTRRLCALL